MAKCKNCTNLHEHWCEKIVDSPCEDTERECDQYKCMTQAERIRSMTDEELAKFLCKVKSDYQWMEHEFPSEEEYGEWEEWLQSEADRRDYERQIFI